MTAARAEANEFKIRATEADETAKLEAARRESEEKLRMDASEREKKIYQQWVDEHEVRKEAEIKMEKVCNSCFVVRCGAAILILSEDLSARSIISAGMSATRHVSFNQGVKFFVHHNTDDT